jgi:hypothetical protein
VLSHPYRRVTCLRFLTTASREPFSSAMDPAYLNKSEWRPSFPFVTSAERFPQRLST